MPCALDRFLPLTLGDENVLESKQGDLEKDYLAWSNLLVDRILPGNRLGFKRDGEGEGGGRMR